MSEARAFGRTIQLFLIDGTPNGLRKATIHGWTGSVLVADQSSFSRLLQREEADRTGVYILVGPDPEKPLATRAYIGSANSVRKRINESSEERPFWEVAITVTTSDDDLSKGHAEYLEARLIQRAAQAGRATLENVQKPNAFGLGLPEADAANMEQFLVNLEIILPVIGLDIFKPQPTAISQSARPESERISGDVEFEIRHKSGVQATAVEQEGEFVVLQGSEALAISKSYNAYANLKEDLISSGVLTADGGKLRFVKPYSFKSPSAAAAVILDRNSNGRTEWKVRGAKLTYNDWQQAQAETAEQAK